MDQHGETLPNEKQLLLLLASDLSRHFRLVVLIYQRQLYGLAYGLMGHPQDAEEIVQEALIRAYRALADYPCEQICTLKLKAWLSTIVLNCSRNALRDRLRSIHPQTISIDTPKTAMLVDMREACLSPSAEEEALALDERSRVYAQLRKLPVAWREVLSLHYISGLSYAAIAVLLGYSVNTVKSHARRGIHQLNELFEKEGE
jgi:RNA polymerase sigma-70 factor (ECF subfamily)